MFWKLNVNKELIQKNKSKIWHIEGVDMYLIKKIVWKYNINYTRVRLQILKQIVLGFPFLNFSKQKIGLPRL